MNQNRVNRNSLRTVPESGEITWPNQAQRHRTRVVPGTSHAGEVRSRSTRFSLCDQVWDAGFNDVSQGGKEISHRSPGGMRYRRSVLCSHSALQALALDKGGG